MDEARVVEVVVVVEKPPMKIENWHIWQLGYGSRPFYHLIGEIEQHYALGNCKGRPIRTSYIVAIDGDTVKTFSGSTYILGTPCSDPDANTTLPETFFNPRVQS